MKPYYEDDQTTIHNGDCREILQALPDDSIDAVVTDPPYGLAFMAKRWDYDVPSIEAWAECLRVLKPGGHLLAFAGTRTQHRMAVRIEDAGFEIRDMIAWVYGSGFPKSLDVSKAIDKAAGAEREVTGQRMGDVGIQGGNFAGSTRRGVIELRDQPATPEAQQWSGWGTALKPALEPITVARKPLCGTVAENVLQYGTGGINVDGCRVEGRERTDYGLANSVRTQKNTFAAPSETADFDGTKGRWPANLIHDGSEEVTGLFPETGPSKASAGVSRKNGVLKHGGQNARPSHDTTNRITEAEGYNDSGGSAARFFYTAKADKADRGHGNTHPTVKPQALMRYLVRLVCQPGGVVLDPFSGSGTTAKMARLMGRKAIGIEVNQEYCDIAVERLRQRVLF